MLLEEKVENLRVTVDIQQRISRRMTTKDIKEDDHKGYQRG